VSAPAVPDPRPAARVGLGEVAREWGRIGVLGFGGPPAHVALLRDLVVERRGWLDAQTFADANAACGLLPGPASTQLAIFCAQAVAGLRGAVVGGLAFILPGLVLILVLAAAALGDAPPRWLVGLGAGAGAAVVAVVVHAGVVLGRASLGGLRGARAARAAAYLVAGAVAAAALGILVVVVLLACGLLELGLRRGAAPGRATALALPALLLVAATELPELAWTALKVGALSYGGGFVIIPLMQGDAVDAQGWMTQAEFLDAVAFGQLTPGPVVQTVGVVGYAAAGLGGGLLAAAVAFGPSFLIVGLGGRRFEALRASPGARAFLDGAGPAAVGAILGAAVPLLAGVEEGWQWAVLAVAAMALALRRSPLVVLLGAAVVGVAVALGGGPLPR
jgi:chromate transporter